MRSFEPSTHVEVVAAAPHERAILANLFELYAHDFSEFHPLRLGADGRFGYDALPLYWEEPGRRPFLVRVGGELAGFVLVQRGSEVSGRDDVWDVAEFFIVRGCRRHGVGTRAAHEVWGMFPGPWEVRVLDSNRAAREFWGRAVAAYVGAPVRPLTLETGGARWHLFTFESLTGGEVSDGA